MESQRLTSVLRIEYGECPPGCQDCLLACAQRRGGGRIMPVHLPPLGFHSALTCLQCGEPACQGVCPVGAVARSPKGIVHLDEDRCVGCGLCALVCPYGGIGYDPVAGKAWKCDLCDGSPVCVDACRYGVLSLLRPAAVFAHFREPDPFVPGSGLCPGCPAELALRTTLRIIGKEVVLFGAPGCATLLICGLGLQTTYSGAGCLTLMTNIPSMMTGVKRYYRKQGREVKVVAFVGDGSTADVGFQPLSGAAERGENLLYICYDNEGYMNTGIQRSSTTSPQAWTTTTPTGKGQPAKNLPLIMAFHGIPYVATASVSFLEDYALKLEKAAAVRNGLAYIHLLSPCPTGWRARTEDAIKIGRLAVDTNYFPLWEAEAGVFRLTYEPRCPQPIGAFTRLMGRFDHLTGEEVDALQRLVDGRFQTIKNLSRLERPARPEESSLGSSSRRDRPQQDRETEAL